MRVRSQMKFIVKILTIQITKAYWMILLYQTKIAKMTLPHFTEILTIAKSFITNKKM